MCLIGVACAQRIAPGNKIRIICEQEPTLSVEREVSDDGEIVLPLLGKLTVGGMYLVELETELEKRLAAKLRTDNVLVAIMLVPTPGGPVQFAGAVNRHGSVPYHDGLTLGEVMKLAEPNNMADLEAVEITSADGKVVIADASKEGSLRLKPGDRVFFARAAGTSDVLIVGAVAKPGSKEFKPGLTLRTLIDLAGGITGHGVLSQIKLERKNEQPRTIDLTATAEDVPLQRGDVVTIPAIEKGRYVAVNGFVRKPGMVEFREGMTLSQAVEAAGGLMSIGSRDAITVKRTGAWKRRYNLDNILAKKDDDVILAPSDIIEIPMARPKIADKPAERGPRKGPVVPPL